MAEETGNSQCPSCGGEIVVPKSTKHFICKHCDALLKASGTENGYVLKVLGKSVDEDAEFRSLGEEVERLKLAVVDMHSKYELEAVTPIASSHRLIKIVGAIAFAAGLLAWVFMDGLAGTVLVAAGAALFVIGFLVQSSSSRAKAARLAALGEKLEALARERDTVQARASRIRVTS